MSYKDLRFVFIPTLFLLVSAPSLAIDNELKIGGSLRANYSYNEFSDVSKDNSGSFDFDMFALKVQDKFEDIGVVAEYRFMKGYDFLKYGYAYWEMNDDLTLNMGLINKPFGNKNYTSNNWWYSLNYYMGFEDSYGMGASAAYNTNSWSSEISFIKKPIYGGNDHRNFSATVSSGTVGETTYNNEEKNTIDMRQSYTTKYGELTSVFGLSLEYGKLYNSVEREDGETFSYAGHVDFEYHNWNIQLQYLDFDFDQYDDGYIDTNKIGMGMLTSFFETASSGNIYTVNVAKKFIKPWGSVTVYNDFSALTPDTEGFDDSILNSIGVSVSYKKLFFYFDYYTAKNVLWLGGNNLGLERQSDDWQHRFNINMAYYF